MTNTPPAHEVEGLAQAMYEHRYRATNGPWAKFKERKPDIAEIYRENARAAIVALDRLRQQSHARAH